MTAIHVVNPERHGSLITHNVSEALIGAAMGPYLLASLFDMQAGMFPPHPHAGFSVATYLLPESATGFINQDSVGTRNRIAPGSLHVTLAGRGVLHEEQPDGTGISARGFQIWIDHADADRELPPAALHLSAGAVPRVERQGHCARVLLGEYGGQQSPLTLPTPARLIDLKLLPGAPLQIPLDRQEQAFLFVLEGQVQVNQVTISSGAVAVSSLEGAALQLSGVGAPARATLFSGRSLAGPRFSHGPFVASSREQLQRFMSRYQRGEFGSLRPFSEQS